MSVRSREVNGVRLCARMWLVFLLAAIGPLTSKAAEPESALEACALEGDDKRRLACYDAEVARLGGAESAAAGESDDSTEPSTAKSRQDRPQSGDAAEEVDDFGMTPALSRKKKSQEGEVEERDSLAAVVARLDEKPYGERIVYLDNGQVWEEISRNRNLPLAVGDDITIKSAAFGSYKLIGPGGKRFSRVRRVR